MSDNGINDLMAMLFLSANPIAVKIAQNHFANLKEYNKRCAIDKSLKDKPREKDVYEKLNDIFNKMERGLFTKFKASATRGFYDKSNLTLGLRDSIKGESFGSEDDPDYGWFVVTLNDPKCNDKNHKGALIIKIYAGQVESFSDYVLGVTYELKNVAEDKSIKRYLYIKEEIINGKKVIKLLGSEKEIPGADKSKVARNTSREEEVDDEYDTWYRRDKKSTITESWKERKNAEFSNSRNKKQSNNTNPQIEIPSDYFQKS